MRHSVLIPQTHISNLQREWVGVREERIYEQMGENGIKYQNTRIGALAEKSEQKDVFH